MSGHGENELNVKQKSRENLILLVLGSSKKLSMLHLEKETFLLWKFHPDINEFIRFTKHYRGPYSRDIKETIERPMYLISCWKYLRPDAEDELTGGFVEISQKGEKEYQRLVLKMQERPELLQLLSAIKMVGQLYHDLKPEELLLLIYDTYPEYKKNSEVYRDINRKRHIIAHNMYARGLIDQERFESLTSKGS